MPSGWPRNHPLGQPSTPASTTIGTNLPFTQTQPHAFGPRSAGRRGEGAAARRLGALAECRARDGSAASLSRSALARSTRRAPVALPWRVLPVALRASPRRSSRGRRRRTWKPAPALPIACQAFVRHSTPPQYGAGLDRHRRARPLFIAAGPDRRFPSGASPAPMLRLEIEHLPPPCGFARGPKRRDERTRLAASASTPAGHDPKGERSRQLARRYRGSLRRRPVHVGCRGADRRRPSPAVVMHSE